MTKIWHYMELDKISHLPNEGRELLGKYIYFTEKRDGSCLTIWMRPEKGIKAFFRKLFRKSSIRVLTVSSRHLINAEESIAKNFWDCEDSLPVIEFLKENPTYLIFGELLQVGKDGRPALSPTRIEKHEKVEFIVFDIYDGTQFLCYQIVHQHCYHYGMKCVRLFGEGRFTTMESLLDYRDTMLELCKKEGREGVVLKTFYPNGKPLFVKEKLDTATSHHPMKIDKGQVKYEPLPISEALGAISKAHADLGKDFSDKKKAMPLIAKYIKEEMKKHLCSSPPNYYNLYRQYCNDRGIIIKEEKK